MLNRLESDTHVMQPIKIQTDAPKKTKLNKVIKFFL